mmetsp:Transcript_97727/g.276526  ORF Transcript_97727/g.276526 Transcript_97727/m.276526 type:complete len:204 (-) Transcript_97727:351-962(-)
MEAVQRAQGQTVAGLALDQPPLLLHLVCALRCQIHQGEPSQIEMAWLATTCCSLPRLPCQQAALVPLACPEPAWGLRCQAPCCLHPGWMPVGAAVPAHRAPEVERGLRATYLALTRKPERLVFVRVISGGRCPLQGSALQQTRSAPCPRLCLRGCVAAPHRVPGEVPREGETQHRTVLQTGQESAVKSPGQGAALPVMGLVPA